MSNLTFAAMMLAGVTVLSSTAIAGSSRIGPMYIGDRSANPEHETYGYVVTTQSQQRLGYVGPARNVGAVTGDVEKDTVAYRPLLEIQRNGSSSLWIARE
jgi:hypothetical protein